MGVDTKQRLSKQRHHKTATTTKQRQLQNSDCYKTATTTKRRRDLFKKDLHLKIIKKNLPIFKEKNQRFYKEN